MMSEHDPAVRSGSEQPDIAAWEAPTPDHAPGAGEALLVDVEGFEGPLDLLLALARTQKVDLAKVSVLALANQYLAFVDAAQLIRLELAADYLVMAAWLAFLKSRLLLPKEKIDDGGPTGEELAQRFAFRLMRLEAMREAAAKLMTRQRLGRDVFQRGHGESVVSHKDVRYSAEIYDLLKAYSESRVRTVKHVHVVKARTVWSIKDARSRLERMVGAEAGAWVQLELCLQAYLPSPSVRPTVLASSFGATLEMARDGLVELQQEAPFAPIYVRKRLDAAERERIG